MEQLQRVNEGKLQFCWDDTSKNMACEGEYFGFVFNGSMVRIHRITGVKSPLHRLPSWHENVGQGDRNVLELSDQLIEIPWLQWTSMGGSNKCQGTSHYLLTHRHNLSSFLDSLSNRNNIPL
jgi:hypothetical protein